MAEYNGSIELISGLVQKNKADFPLIEASAVAFYEDGKEIRLPEKIQSVGISQEEKNSIIQSAVDQAHTNTTIASKIEDMDKNSADVTQLKADVKVIGDRLTVAEKGDNDKLRITYNEEVSTLFLHTGDTVLEDSSNVISQTTVKGGGGGSSASYKLILQQDDVKTASSIIKGKTASIKFTPMLTNIEDGSVVKNEKITLYLYVNDALKGTYTQRSCEANSLDVTEFLTTGFNVIKLTASYTEVIMDTGAAITSRSTKSWSFDVIEMFLKSNFSDATVKEVSAVGDKITYTFTPYGNLEKTIYFKLGETTTTMVTSDSERSKSIEIAAPGHGAYPFEVWCTGKVEGETHESDHLYYNIMFAVAGDNTPIVRMVADSVKGQQYSTSVVRYTVYKADSINNKITLAVNDVPSSEATVDRTEQFWYYKPVDFGVKKLSILYDGVEYNSVTVDIEKFPYEITPITSNLDLDFTSVGRTNQDSDYNVFKNNVFDENGNEKKLTWTLSDNFDWVNGGWQVDENGDSFFCVKAGTTATINYNMFADPNIVLGADNAMGNGKEFKLIFKTTNVASADASFLKCLALPSVGSNEVGLEMKVHHGYVKSNNDTLEIPYAEEDIVEFDFNINPAKAVNGVIETTGEIIPMVLSYEDGVPFLPKTYTSTETSFTQNNPVPITIGSTDCDVHIYRMKCYSSYLTNEDVLNNYIADGRNGEEISNRFKRNQIYKNGALTPESLAEARPDLKIIKIKCPYFTNDKDDFVGDTSVEMIHTNGDPALDNWTFSNGFHSGQGTSSNKYGDAGRNIDLLMCFDGVYKHKKILKKYEGREDEYWAIRSEFKSKDGTINIKDGTGKVGLKRTSVPTSYFNIKVNIASSENANNALLANRFDRFLPYTSVGKKRDPFVKNTMEFVNCVVFLQEFDEDISKHREFQDTDWHFYAVGNIGDSKKTDQTRAYDPDDHKEFVVEIMDNNMPNAAFQTGFTDEENPLEIKYPITREQWVEGNEAYDALYADKWDGKKSFEMRYEHPDASDEQSEANIAKWNEFYEWVIMASDDEFKSKLKNWVNLPAAYYYYLFTERYTMMDNRAKNSFWHWSKLYITQAEVDATAEALKGAQDALKALQDAEQPDEEAIAAAQSLVDEKEALHNKALRYTIDDAEAAINEGYRFDWWDYDNDTSLGIDNSGTLRMPYGKEDIDTEIKEDGTENYYFNAGNSVFYRRLRKLFPDELRNAYNQAEISQCFSANNLINEFDAWQAEFPEAIWIEDYERKYARTYRNGTPDHLNKRYTGRKKYHRRQWERDQEGYMASKYRAASTQSGVEDGKPVQYQILMRCKTPSGVVVPPKYEMDLIPYSDMYLNVQFGPNYIETVRAKAGETYKIKSPFSDMTDNQVAVFSGKHIQSIGDISTFYPSEGTFSTGEKLKTLIVGNGTPGYANSYLTTLTTSAKNKMLEYLDIQNLTALKTVYLQIQNLKHFFAQGSGISEAVFANNGLLEEAHLPATISSVVANNLYYLNNLTFEGYDALNKVVFSNCPNIDTLDIVEKAKNLTIARLTGIDWHLSDTTVLNRLLKCRGVQADGITATNQSVLTGRVHVDIIRKAELEAYEAAWPDLKVEYTEEMPQYSIIFRNDNKVIYTMLRDESHVLTAEDDPVLNGTIPTPSIPNSEDGQFTYVYKEWQTVDGKPFVGTKITNTDITFDAIYETKVRTYTVNWFKDVNSNVILQTTDVEWGQSAEYDYGENNVNLPVKIPGANDNKFYLFEKWDKASTNVKDNLNIYPVWADSNPNLVDSIPTNQLTAADIYGLKQVKDLSGTGKKFSTPGQVLTLQMGYMPTFNNVEEDVLISSTTTFDGSTQYKDTNYSLFKDNDSSFVLALDFEMGRDTTGTLVSCFFNNRNGFKVEPASGANTVPSVVYKNNSKRVNIGFIAPSADRTHREICVIRKVKGDNRLYVYTNNRYSLDEVQENVLFDTDTFASMDNKLCFGATLTSDGSHNNFAAGTIHYAKLWLDDIGVDECKKICSWTYEKQEFEYVGKGLHFYENSDINCQATFVAKNLLDEIIEFNKFGQNEITLQGYGSSQLRQWLQKKPFLGASLLWQQVISKVQVPTLLGYNDMNESSFGELYAENGEAPSDYFYIPCAADLDSSFLTGSNTVYKNESTSGESYPIFAQNSDRIKTLGNSGIQYSYWTRSPYRSDNQMYGVVPNNRDASSKPAGSLSNYYRSAENGEQRFFHTYSTDYQRSTKQHGVLITFSI